MGRKQASIGIAALLAGAGAAWLAAKSNDVPSAPLGLLVGWSFIGSGLAACRARPENPLGKVMVFTGFAWFASFLARANQPLLFTIGAAVQCFYLVGLGYLVLAFPSGRLHAWIDRLVIWLAIAIVTVLQILSMVLDGSGLCPGCPANLLAVAGDSGLANVITQIERLGGAFLALVILLLLAVRWSRATVVRRRDVAAMVLAGAVTLALVAVTELNAALRQPLGNAPGHVVTVALASLPLAMLYVLLQRRLARAAVAGLVVELGEPEVAADLRQALVRVLGDPSLDVAYWFPRAGRYVDVDGRPVELPPPESGRCTTVVERSGQPIAALVHDPALQENAELINSVCAAAAMTLENQRLQAELRARLADLHASRGRLVDATQAERRRIERDLHDGTQQRLVSLAMSLGLLETKLPADAEEAKPIAREAQTALAAALQELRELSQGIHPAVLTERGLAAALQDLADRAALPAYIEVSIDERPRAAVEAAAYFMVSEALTNAAKYSYASEVKITAAREPDALIVEVADDGIGGAVPQGGSGLRGLMDRVEALGGKLDVSSPLGRGTTLRAEVPWASDEMTSTELETALNDNSGRGIR